MKLLVLALLLLPAQALAHCVILLHGLQGSPRLMAPMAVALADAGYVTFNAGYPSTAARVEELAEAVFPRALEACPDGPVDVVAHSMGGILLRAWQSDRFRRVVLIGTPNAGSELVDAVEGWSLIERINGPAAAQLGTKGVVLDLPKPAAETAVVIGTRNRSWLYSLIIPGRDDGRVSVASADLPSAVARLRIGVDHNRLPYHPRVIAQVIAFLETGRFFDPAKNRD